MFGLEFVVLFRKHTAFRLECVGLVRVSVQTLAVGHDLSHQSSQNGRQNAGSWIGSRGGVEVLVAVCETT